MIYEWITEMQGVSIFITHDVMFHCFHYRIRVYYTMWLPWLSLSLLNTGYAER